MSVAVLSATISVLKADLYGIPTLTDNELTGCRFQGFLIYETFGCCYMSFVLQAIYRLTKVLYPKYKFLQVYTLQFSFDHSFHTCMMYYVDARTTLFIL